MPGPLPGGAASIRDVYDQRELGTFRGTFNATVPPMDARLLKVTFS